MSHWMNQINSTLSQRFNLSKAWFRSTDLWVMGPARFHCATLLVYSIRGSQVRILPAATLECFSNNFCQRKHLLKPPKMLSVNLFRIMLRCAQFRQNFSFGGLSHTCFHPLTFHQNRFLVVFVSNVLPVQSKESSFFRSVQGIFEKCVSSGTHSEK